MWMRLTTIAPSIGQGRISKKSPTLRTLLQNPIGRVHDTLAIPNLFDLLPTSAPKSYKSKPNGSWSGRSRDYIPRSDGFSDQTGSGAQMITENRLRITIVGSDEVKCWG